MKRCLWTGFVLILLVVSGCGRTTGIPSTPGLAQATPLPTAIAKTTTTPDAENAARTYLDNWKKENYSGMYNMLTQVSKDAITEKDFTAKYRNVAAEAALGKGIDYEILSSLINPRTAQVSYRVTLHSVLVGDIQRETVMNLSLDTGQWQVQWDDALILPELKGGNHLSMDYHIPARANIYDRNGKALVAQSDAIAIGLRTGELDLGQQDDLLGLLSEITKGQIQPEAWGPEIDNYRNNGWYLPVTDVAADVLAPYEARLSSFPGVNLSAFRSRYYFDDAAPHVVGYMTAIQPEEVESFQRQGYQWTERVGRDGLELWGEQYLAGKRSGALYVVSPDVKILTILKDIPSQPAQAITTTIDKDLQIGAQQAIAGFKGAIVVLERNTGRVLAMVSSPGFNPNLFEPENFNQQFLINTLNGPDTPLFNRATQGQYPLGSVFKIVTMAAALKSGLYTADTTFNCTYHFEELPGVTLNDWTWEYYQKDGRTQASGMLTLSQGLTRSCNPYFWHIGLDLYDQGMTKAVSDMARGFGLGSTTGIELHEEAGQIPDPASQIDATNGAIGQGGTLVTPLQVADFIAAVGNGGTLYRPSVVEKIGPPDGSPTIVFTPTVRSTLPISSAYLSILQDALVSVIRDPNGTAHHRFLGFNIPMAGKTGTAQDPPRDPHAWFVAYTSADLPDKPDIAVAVVVENAGEGSDYAAPIARRILEIYFEGSPKTTYWWESRIGVSRNTPGATGTPTPESSPTPTQ